MNKNTDVITIKYQLSAKNGTQKTFTVRLNSSTVEYISQPPATYPQWTELTFNQCPNCPLDPATHKHCPVALNSVELVEFFKEITSIEEVHLRVETDERNYSKDTDMQTAAGSLLGIIMATSQCPILSQLKPMARFHLPFASLDETRYRAISMYLLGQFFVLKQGGTPDWTLAKLDKLYMNIDTVNRAFINRLRHIEVQDSTLNAMGKLTVFDQDIHYSITDKSMHEIEEIFQPYLNSGTKESH